MLKITEHGTPFQRVPLKKMSHVSKNESFLLFLFTCRVRTRVAGFFHGNPSEPQGGAGPLQFFGRRFLLGHFEESRRASYPNPDFQNTPLLNGQGKQQLGPTLNWGCAKVLNSSVENW